MKLIGSETSPYVRKVRVYLAESGIPYSFEPVDAWAPDAERLAAAPLGKVPVLLRDEGPPLFESLLILEYLDSTRPFADRLLPADGEPRWQVLRGHALAHGLIEATSTRIVELRREEAQRSATVLAREEGRVARALETFERELDGREWLAGERMSLADLILGVALQYLDFRYPHDWRSAHTHLARWISRVGARPAYQTTLPPGFKPLA